MIIGEFDRMKSNGPTKSPPTVAQAPELDIARVAPRPKAEDTEFASRATFHSRIHFAITKCLVMLFGYCQVLSPTCM